MVRHDYNPDVLNCLANLSNDEVFTPPTLANQMLDLLPKELFANPKTTFLDPFCKSGVFLREIVKRLDRGLQEQIPDRQERIDHILRHQVYGIAITELTSLLSRRSVYCSKMADGQLSVTHFDTPEGNIQDRPLRHTWENGKCRYCGASQAVYDRGEAAEQYAYQFIHTDNPEKLFNMKFDVIIGNPPYQLNVGVEKENYAIAIYDKFVEQAKKLNPRYLCMIIPARWYSGGRGLDSFRDAMLHDDRISDIVDYPNAVDCFPGVDISGGVCYFLWQRDYKGKCKVRANYNGKETIETRPLLEPGTDSFIRFNEAISVIRKVKGKEFSSFSAMVSPQTPFGIVSSFDDFKREPFPNSIKIHTVNGEGYVNRDYINRNIDLVDCYKVYISKSYGERGTYPYRFLAKPFVGEPNSCCTQTYLVIGPFDSKNEVDNAISYIRTKFFRFMVMQKKNTQDAMSKVYQFVPMQDFSHPWTDEMLYEKYNLTDEEIAFIESMIRPME